MNQVVKSKGLMYGLILGFILALMTTYAYSVDLSFLVKPWLIVVFFFLVIILGILAISASKKGLEGYITFKDAFSTYFLVIVVGFLISSLISLLIFNVIDPGAQEEIKQMSIDKVTDMMENFDVPQENIDEAIAKIQEQDSFSFISQIKNYFISLAIYSVFGLLLAAIMKKNNPELE
jgi:hypothetical protein